MRLFSTISYSQSLFAGLMALALALPASAQQSSPNGEPRRTPMPGEGPSKGRDPSRSEPNRSPQSDPNGPGGKGANPRSATPSTPGAPTAKGQVPTKQVPAIAVIQPRTPAEREKALSDLYAHLAAAENEAAAKTVAASIEKLWLSSGSDTVSLLMERAIGAIHKKKPEIALKVLDEIVALAPDYAEGWNQRAYLHFTRNQVQQALGDIRRVLALDPNHFKALDGLVHVLKEIGQKKGALAAAKKLLEVHPFSEGTQAIHDELAREIEGQAL